MTGAGFEADGSRGAGAEGTASGAIVGHVSSSGARIDSALVQALRFAPPVSRSAAYEIDFTDWARIESSDSFRLPANASTAQQESFLTGAQDAGVDIAQDSTPTTLFPFPALRWEAYFYSDEGPLRVAGFQPGFAVSRISEGLTRCHFRSSSFAGFVIYTGSASRVFNCGPSGTGVVAPYSVYAVDAKDEVLVMSTTPSAVHAAITGTGLSSGSPPLADVLAPLSADPAMTIELGASYCTQITHAITRHLTAEQTHTLLRFYPAGAPYAAFGLGESVVQQPPTGQIVMDYGNEAAASAQLFLREHLLKTERSFSSEHPYSKYLTLETGATQAGDIVLTVKPAHGNRLALDTMAQNLDFAYARC